MESKKQLNSKMAYKVFISHSTRDMGLVITLSNLLTKFEVETIVAEWYLTPGARIDSKVFDQIDKSDCIVVLLMKNGTRTNLVQQEIGYAIKAGKPIIPIVEKGVDPKDLVSLQGIEYIEYDFSQLRQTLLKASTYVKSLKLKEEEQDKALLIVGGILMYLIIMFGREK